jgi:hypothetical protein
MCAIKHHHTEFTQLRQCCRAPLRVALDTDKYASHINMDTLALAVKITEFLGL